MDADSLGRSQRKPAEALGMGQLLAFLNMELVATAEIGGADGWIISQGRSFARNCDLTVFEYVAEVRHFQRGSRELLDQKHGDVFGFQPRDGGKHFFHQSRRKPH